MAEALKEARSAFERGECPVGEVLVRDEMIVARAGNQELELRDPTAHAEMLVLRQAGPVLESHTFPDCVVYTTLWPCPMCENALLRAKIPMVVCGGRSFRYIQDNTFNATNLTRIGPIMEEECRGLFLRWAKETGRDFLKASDIL